MGDKNQKTPKNWPNDVKFVSDLQFSGDLSKNLQVGNPNCSFGKRDIELMQKISVSKIYGLNSTQHIYRNPTALKTVRIDSLADFPNHPASPYYGLFATKNLLSGQLIIPYYGLVTKNQDAFEESDYCLRLNNLAVDANSIGNEGRFVNDYRGILDKPNAEFKEFINIDLNRIEMGIFVISNKSKEGIKKKQEICVSYGKGFWSARSGKSNS
ncbi:hypothetical protein AYI68_g6689 [Smittium mucronatum]|uniref:SET domain-containing protein n=1 Tax=Smittium mucronatum TaxID=133383 RepID=A0A1R0GQU4_9FUNG|nr:hypothetical protein AYI68_g6689 [Smittium mucronatum]